MATQPDILVVPTIDEVQASPLSWKQLGTAEGPLDLLSPGDTTGSLSSTVVFSLDSLTAGQQIGADWGSENTQPAGTALSNQVLQITLILRPR